MASALTAAGVDDREFAITGTTILIGLLRIVVGILITSVWYWVGARVFRRKPTFSNCLIAAIVLPVAMFFLQIFVGFVVVFFAILNGYLGLLALVVAVIYLLVLYVRWVNRILEIESAGVAFLLVILPTLFQIVVALLSGGSNSG
jgi:hypothetical protein